VTFAKSGNENVRLLWLAGTAAAVELVVVPLFASDLLLRSAQWPSWAHLLVISLPRLLLMTVLVAALGPFRSRALFGAFVVLYAALLFFRFRQVELYINWEDPVAWSRATLPYVGGLIGVAVGFWMRKGRSPRLLMQQ
jgi:hypothetical protein